VRIGVYRFILEFLIGNRGCSNVHVLKMLVGDRIRERFPGFGRWLWLAA